MMLTRFLFVLLAVIISTPAAADCPLLKQQTTSDCCHKEKCPKPVNVQPCLDCIADVRSTAVITSQTAQAAIPLLLGSHAFHATVSDESVEPLGPLTDNGSTYLRIGVLRI